MSTKSNPSRSLLETLESRRLLTVAAPADYVLVQGDIAVDSDGTPTQTGIMLDSGANYFVKATGTYTIAPGRLADAEFMQENSAGHPWIKGVKGRPLVAGVADWGNTRDTSTTPEYGGFFTGIPAAGEGATGNEFTPRLNDSYYNDNAGGLMVELYRQVPTVTIEPAIEGGATIREGESDVAAFIVRQTGTSPITARLKLDQLVSDPSLATLGDDFDLFVNGSGTPVQVNDGLFDVLLNDDQAIEITLTAKADTTIEGLETVRLSVYDDYQASTSDPKEYVIGSPSEAEVEIADIPVASVSSADDEAAEADVTDTATVTVTVDGFGDEESINVYFKTLTGEASDALIIDDYTIDGATYVGSDTFKVTVPNESEGSGTADVTITAIDDTVPEDDEFVRIELVEDPNTSSEELPPYLLAHSGPTTSPTSQPTTRSTALEVTIKDSEKAIDLDLDSNYDGKIDNSDEKQEQTRGGIVVRNFDDVYEDTEQPARRKELKITATDPAFDGTIRLLRNSSNFKLFTKQKFGEGDEIAFNGDGWTDEIAAAVWREGLWIQGGADASGSQADVQIGIAIGQAEVLQDAVAVTNVWVDIEQRTFNSPAIDGNNIPGKTSGNDINHVTGTFLELGAVESVTLQDDIAAQANIEMIGSIGPASLDLGEKLPVGAGFLEDVSHAYARLGFVWHRLATTRHYAEGVTEPIVIQPPGGAPRITNNDRDDSAIENQDVTPTADPNGRLLIADYDGPSANFAKQGIASEWASRGNMLQWVSLTLAKGGTFTEGLDAQERCSSKVKWAFRLNVKRDTQNTPDKGDDVLSWHSAAPGDQPNDGQGDNEVLLGQWTTLSLDLKGPSIASITASSPAPGRTRLVVVGSNLDPKAQWQVQVQGVAQQVTIIDDADNRPSVIRMILEVNTAALGKQYSVSIENPDGGAAQRSGLLEEFQIW